MEQVVIGTKPTKGKDKRSDHRDLFKKVPEMENKIHVFFNCQGQNPFRESVHFTMAVKIH